MRIGLHLTNFMAPGGTRAIAAMLQRVLSRAEQVGVHSIWPMDQLAQIPIFGDRSDPLPEAYTTLAWAAGQTRRLELGALVTGGPYHQPVRLIKTVSTLDVLSGGRAWLGLGADWNDAETRGLGIAVPGMSERFERLEEVLQLAHRMYAGDPRSYHGTHYRLADPINQPTPLRRPPILVGGGGERRTLRLVARYADACNLFERLGPQALRHKLDVLRRHCDDADRPYEQIVKTTFGALGPHDVTHATQRFGQLAELGIDLALVDLPDPDNEAAFHFLGEVIRQVAPLGRALPTDRH